MKYNTKEIITILRHCGNQGNACPCADCLLKDNAKGNECMEMYNVAADKIEDQFKEIKSNEQIIADLTRAVCLKDVKIKRLKALLKKAKDLAISDLCEVCNTKCVNAGMNEDKPTERCGCFKWKHADEVEEALKDEV